MTFQVLCTIIATLWLASLVACALAFRWSYRGTPNRFAAAVLCSAGALLIGYLGATRFHVTASKTVNGQVQWRFDSKWFFILTTILAALTLAYTFWKRKSRKVA